MTIHRLGCVLKNNKEGSFLFSLDNLLDCVIPEWDLPFGIKGFASKCLSMCKAEISRNYNSEENEGMIFIIRFCFIVIQLNTDGLFISKLNEKNLSWELFV